MDNLANNFNHCLSNRYIWKKVGITLAVHLYEKYREDVAVVLSSKLDEFKVFDYDQVSEDDLWNFLLTKKWRKPREDVHIYEIVRDILNVKVSDFISFQTVEHLKGPDWFSDAGAGELEELLKK